MAKAMLTYIDEDNNNITLESGSLFYIDQNTKDFKNMESLREKYHLKIRGKKGKIKLFYIRSSSIKEEVPILVNDKKNIYIKDDYFEDHVSEIERGRKLLFNSKNKLFLKLSLKYKLVKDTFKYQVPLSKKQYDFALKKKLKVRSDKYEYFIDTKDLLDFIVTNNKAQLLREPFENCLETWKKYITNMTLEELYYYSRNIRILINNYNKLIRKRISIRNFEPRNGILKLLKYNTYSLQPINEVLKVRKKVKE